MRTRAALPPSPEGDNEGNNEDENEVHVGEEVEEP